MLTILYTAMLFIPSTTFASDMYPTELTSTAHEASDFALRNNLTYKKLSFSVREDDPRQAAELITEHAQEPLSITRYGYDLIRTGDAVTDSEFRVRGGLSKFSKKASAGVELILSW
ncbi:MAG: hypothetical protein KDD55_06520 [Bdellovibrionales bacterium]|nr:hypothetical protein [Bdellovibrionales bacterium]